MIRRVNYLIWLSMILLLVSGCAKANSTQPDTKSPAPATTETAAQTQTAQSTQISENILSTIPETTSDKNLNVAWAPQQGEKLYINNNEVNTDANGNIIINDLKPGKNDIDLMLYSGRRLISHKTKTITYNPFPVLNILTPAQTETSTDKPFTIIVGNVTPGSKIFIDNDEVAVEADGFFSKKCVLNPEMNSFIVKALGKDGKVSTSTVTMTFNPPKPTVTIQTPSFNSSEVSDSTENTFSIVGFTEPNNLVQVFVNPDDQNQAMKSAVYEGTVDASGKFNVSVNLSENANVVRLIVSNRFGESVTNDYPVTGKKAP